MATRSQDARVGSSRWLPRGTRHAPMPCPARPALSRWPENLPGRRPESVSCSGLEGELVSCPLNKKRRLKLRARAAPRNRQRPWARDPASADAGATTDLGPKRPAGSPHAQTQGTRARERPACTGRRGARPLALLPVQGVGDGFVLPGTVSRFRFFVGPKGEVRRNERGLGPETPEEARGRDLATGVKQPA